MSLVNIGVGPSNAKNITDHLAVLRPNCWLMVGHCGGLARQSSPIGDYVLAHAYLRQDRILDDWCRRACRSRRWPRCRSRCRSRRPRHRRGGRRAEAAPAHRHRRHQRRPQLGAALHPGAAAHQPVARHRRRHGERHDRRARLSGCACPMARCCASPTSRCMARSSCRARPMPSTRPPSPSTRDRPRRARSAASERRDTLHSRKLRSFDEPPFR